MLSSTPSYVMKWKNLSDDVSVTSFASRSNAQPIYIKKIKAIKASKSPITIFLFHDLASYHGRFLNFVNWFRAQHPQVNFVMMDFLGHGLSSGTRAHIEHFNDLANDVAYIFNTFEKQPSERWIGLGHGIGALCLLDLVNRFDEATKIKVDQLILSNFVLNFSGRVMQLQNKLLDNFQPLAHALKTSRLVEIYSPEEMLTYPKDQAAYLEDPLIVRKPTFQTFKCINSKVMSIYQDAYFLDKPTLLLQSNSSYLFNRGMDSFSKGFKKGLLVEKKYSNLKHDLYNEKDNLEVFNDIAEWIQS